MKYKVVLGSQFGDEGKGVVTNYLCEKPNETIVVRFSGGHQVGHTVVHNNIRHIFSNFGSGTLKNVPTYWSKFCTIDPIGIARELKDLNDLGIIPRLFIDSLCPITTYYDKKCNSILPNYINNGTCGVGFGSTIKREEDHFSLLAGDLLYNSVTKEKLKLISSYYNILSDKDYEYEFMQAISSILLNTNITICSYVRYPKIIFEGSQGLLLDKNIGFFPHVTRSNTDTTNIRKITTGDLDVYLVSRCYQTRHGHGPMTNEDLTLNLKNDIIETNVYNKFQGEFRKTVLDLDLIKYAISRDSNIKKYKLALTCLEHIDGDYTLTNNGELVTLKNIYELRNYVCTALKADDILLFKDHKKLDL